ncbi:MAG: hypothetical protein FJ115_16235 [Deltaproteobacteria bacterium]|nr:hypothetical protein [Deltaproteobacteria bacterium]MBM4325105.1 hypothetical protein [Deltaproteobacteria bacterium]
MKKMSNYMTITLACLIIVFVTAPSSAEVYLKCSEESEMCKIEIAGLIRPEDLVTFKRIIGAYNRKTRQITTATGDKSLWEVTLDSPGGDTMTAMAIGDLMYQNEFKAWVDRGASCSSACVFILGSSVRRDLSLFAEIKIHRPYSDSTDTSFTQATSNFARIEKIAVSQFKRVGVSAGLWDEIMRVPPQTTRTLSPDEWLKYGLIGTDPAYADAEDSRSAKRLGITKKEYLRRMAIYDECVKNALRAGIYWGIIDIDCQKVSGRIR